MNCRKILFNVTCGVLLILFFGGSGTGASSFGRSDNQNGLQAWFNRECANGRDRAALQRIRDAIDDFQSCGVTVLQTELQQELLEAVLSGRDDVQRLAAEKTCQQYKKFKNCIRNLIETFKACESEDELPFDTMIEVSDEIIDFICVDEGRRLEAMLEEDVGQCFEQRRPTVMACVQRLKDLEKTSPLTLDARGCRAIREAKECVMNSLEECGGTATQEMMNGLYGIIERRLPCTADHSANRHVQMYSGSPAQRPSFALLPLALALVLLLLLRPRSSAHLALF